MNGVYKEIRFLFYDINKLLNHNNLNIKKKVYKILVYLSIYAVDWIYQEKKSHFSSDILNIVRRLWRGLTMTKTFFIFFKVYFAAN